MSEPEIRVLICKFGTVEDLLSRADPTVTGWTECSGCGQGVVMHGDDPEQVAAGVLCPLCIRCADAIAVEHPEAFDPSRRERSR